MRDERLELARLAGIFLGIATVGYALDGVRGTVAFLWVLCVGGLEGIRHGRNR